MPDTTHQGAEGAGQSYQERVRQHFLYVAGEDTTDMPERRDRACEEFAELQQALGGTLEGWIAVGRYVWGRPVGEPAQEMGGTLNTLAALAAWADLDMMACAEAELERTKRPEIVAKIRRKRANRHGRGVLPGNNADLVTAALASPRADNDERTASVLWSAWSEDDCDSDPRIDPMAQKATEWFVGRWPVGADEPECRILIGAGRSAEIIARRIAEKLTSILNTDVILARKSATPAQPAGAVPDTLRALIGEAGRWDCPKSGSPGLPDDHEVSVPLGSLRALDKFFASHLAGQSAGTGETIAVQKRDLIKMVDAAFAVDPSVPTEAQSDSLFAAATKLASYLPLGLECTGCGSRESIEVIQARGFSSCCPERKMQPAPDSTRTGQGEAKERLIGPTMTPEQDERIAFNLCGEFGCEYVAANAEFAKAFYAELYAAARPAAPEAQGADIEDRLSEILTDSQRQDLSDRLLGAYMAPHGGLRLDNAEVAYLWTKLGGAL